MILLLQMPTPYLYKSNAKNLFMNRTEIDRVKPQESPSLGTTGPLLLYRDFSTLPALAISAHTARNVDFEDDDLAFQLTAQGRYGSNSLLVSVPGDQNSIFGVEM
jgi:hypothetical protein